MNLHDLSNFLPPEAIILDEESLRVYECDAMTSQKVMPACVVMPDSIEQVQALMKYCNENQIAVIPRGAGTGLSGGALPRNDAILISLARMQNILELDPQNAFARVQPGVRNLSISEAAKPYGLYYAPDPSSQIACTIGGNIAENSGGVHCLKYGLTVNNVLALKIVTSEGELLEIGSLALDSSGLDLLAVIHGSEGMLGIVVEVTVKLLPKPAASRVLLAAFDQVATAANGVSAIISQGIVPAGLEMMDKPCIDAVEAFLQPGYPDDAAAILLCEVDGLAEDVEGQLIRISEILNKAGATSIKIAKDDNESEKFWAGRKAAFPAVGRISPDYFCMDGTIPRRALAEVLESIAELSKQFGLAVVNVFHAGDGNLHPLILYDASKQAELEQAEVLGSEILQLCVRHGGTITGEHGVGVEKINEMCVQFSNMELQQFHALKAAFDPQTILNPGKAIPTLNRCAEFGAMHVHSHQEDKFAHLERF